MSVTLYDEAVLQKLRYWTSKTNVHVYSVEETTRLFQVMADENKDSPVKLPLIALKRVGGYTISNPNKKPLTFDGASIKMDLDNQLISNLNAIPITIMYKLDIYARHLKEADAYARNFVYNFINYPTLQIMFKYNGLEVEHNANIILSNNVEDNSSIPEKRLDQFSRLTMTFEIQDAYLWDIRINSIKTIQDGIVLEIYNDEFDDDFITEQII